MSTTQDGKNIICKMQEIIRFIEENWSDDIGKQYIYWLRSTQTELSTIERRREILNLKCSKISILCKKAMEESEDTPKKLENAHY